MEQNVNLFLWKANKADLVTANNIATILVTRCSQTTNGLVTIKPNIQDLHSYSAGDEIIDDPTLVFGSTTRGQIQHSNTDICWTLPPIGNLNKSAGAKTRQDTYNKLLEIATVICAYSTRTDEATRSCVETTTGVTIGLTGTDINLTKDEVENLLKIRELMGGGKMVVTKGSIRIEVDSCQEPQKAE